MPLFRWDVLVLSKGNYPIVDLDFVQAGLHFLWCDRKQEMGDNFWFGGRDSDSKVNGAALLCEMLIEEMLDLHLREYSIWLLWAPYRLNIFEWHRPVWRITSCRLLVTHAGRRECWERVWEWCQDRLERKRRRNKFNFCSGILRWWCMDVHTPLADTRAVP